MRKLDKISKEIKRWAIEKDLRFFYMCGYYMNKMDKSIGNIYVVLFIFAVALN